MPNTASKTPKIDRRRTLAILALRDKNPSQLSAQLGISYRHLYGVLTGERELSARLRESLQVALGPAGWAFASCESHMLCAEESEHDPA